MFQRPGEGEPDVAGISPQAGESVRPLRVLAAGSDAKREEPTGVASPNLTLVLARIKLLERVFAGCLQEKEAAAVSLAQQALVNKRLEVVQQQR